MYNMNTGKEYPDIKITEEFKRSYESFYAYTQQKILKIFHKDTEKLHQVQIKGLSNINVYELKKDWMVLMSDQYQRIYHITQEKVELVNELQRNGHEEVIFFTTAYFLEFRNASEARCVTHMNFEDSDAEDAILGQLCAK